MRVFSSNSCTNLVGWSFVSALFTVTSYSYFFVVGNRPCHRNLPHLWKRANISWSFSHCPQLWSIFCWFWYVPVMSQEVSMRPFGSVVKRWRTTVPAGLRKHQKLRSVKGFVQFSPHAWLWTLDMFSNTFKFPEWNMGRYYYATFSISRIRPEKRPKTHVFSCILSSF